MADAPPQVIPRVGKLIPPGEGERDAVHIAVMPVQANSRLAPGQYIGFKDVSKGLVDASTDPVGIVDPYLASPVFEGEQFYMFLFPHTITSLRHEWTHPTVDKDPNPISKEDDPIMRANKMVAKARITNWAQANDLSYNAVMAGAEEYLEHDQYMIRGGDFEGLQLPDIFWDHYEHVTGTVVPINKRYSFFSCSC